jgi:hypothetical protein
LVEKARRNRGVRNRSQSYWARLGRSPDNEITGCDQRHNRKLDRDTSHLRHSFPLTRQTDATFCERPTIASDTPTPEGLSEPSISTRQPSIVIVNSVVTVDNEQHTGALARQVIFGPGEQRTRPDREK